MGRINRWHLVKKDLIIKCFSLIILPIVFDISSCAPMRSITTNQSLEFSAEEIELYGYGVGTSPDENTARGMAMTAALGDLSTKLQAEVRTASSNYQKQSGTFNKTLYESLTEVVSQNRLQGVTYKGDKKPASHKGGKYEYRIEARVNQTILKKNVEAIFDDLDATDEERAAFRSEMFGE